MRMTLAIFFILFSATSFALEVSVTKISKSGEKVLLDLGSESKFSVGDRVNFYDGNKLLGKTRLVKISEKKSIWELEGWLALSDLRSVRIAKVNSGVRRGIASVNESAPNFEAEWGNRRPRNKNKFERPW